ncbi:hypothetical protein FOA52_002259 [Chlamydomonas sp. UWO 241]|nr:hypothetical protein FOA52_002259 [Chlamydomonas sp. UWO 241]
MAACGCNLWAHLEAAQLRDLIRERDREGAYSLIEKLPDLLVRPPKGSWGLAPDTGSIWNEVAGAGDAELLNVMVGTVVSDTSPLAPKLSSSKRAHIVREGLSGLGGIGRTLDTPLSRATLAGYTAIVAQLIRLGADPSVRDFSGRTVLHYAARAGNIVISRTIMETTRELPEAVRARHRHAIGIQSNSGLTALHYAAAHTEQNARLMEVLLEQGMSPYVKSAVITTDLGFLLIEGGTPLHTAAQALNQPAVTALLRHQATMRARGTNTRFRDLRLVRNAHGETPGTVARHNRADDVLLQLLHPSTDLMQLFSDQLLRPGDDVKGVPKLAFISAAALKAKLSEDIRFVRESCASVGSAFERTVHPAEGSTNSAAAGTPNSGMGAAGVHASPFARVTRLRLSSSFQAAVGADAASAGAGGGSVSCSGSGGGNGVPGRGVQADGSYVRLEPIFSLRPDEGLPSAGSGDVAEKAVHAHAQEGGASDQVTSAARSGGSGSERGGGGGLMPQQQLSERVGPAAVSAAATATPASSAGTASPLSWHSGPLGTTSNRVFPEDPSRGGEAAASHGTEVAAAEEAAGEAGSSGAGASTAAAAAAAAAGADPPAAAAVRGASQGTDDGTTCMLCFEGVADVSIGGCSHSMCSACAAQMCARVLNAPLTCPFCRASVSAFVAHER